MDRRGIASDGDGATCTFGISEVDGVVVAAAERDKLLLVAVVCVLPIALPMVLPSLREDELKEEHSAAVAVDDLVPDDIL